MRIYVEEHYVQKFWPSKLVLHCLFAQGEFMHFAKFHRSSLQLQFHTVQSEFLGIFQILHLFVHSCYCVCPILFCFRKVRLQLTDPFVFGSPLTATLSQTLDILTQGWITLCLLTFRFYMNSTQHLCECRVKSSSNWAGNQICCISSSQTSRVW